MSRRSETNKEYIKKELKRLRGRTFRCISTFISSLVSISTQSISYKAVSLTQIIHKLFMRGQDIVLSLIPACRQAGSVFVS